MKLDNTFKFIKEQANLGFVKDYAIIVGVGDDIATIYSDNVNENTLFDVASTGKILLTTPLILRCIDDGLLSLEDTLDKFFDNVPEDRKNITIKQLLTHTSGIVRFEFPDFFREKDNNFIAEQIILNPLAFKPGSRYQYSCNGMILLGFIAEKVLGGSLTELMEKYITKPLGLTRSRTWLMPDDKNFAFCCHRTDVSVNMADDENVHVLNRPIGAGGFFWSPHDITIFAKTLRDNSEFFCNKELFDLAISNLTPNFTESRGLGFWIADEKYKYRSELFGKNTFGHHGSAGSGLFIDRTRNLFFLYLTNFRHIANCKYDKEPYDFGTVEFNFRAGIPNAVKRDLEEQNLL